MAPLISVVIPCRADEDAAITLESLSHQTVHDLEIRIVWDTDGRGAPWARNTGAAYSTGDYLLFSDNDICWEPDALETMVTKLRDTRRKEAKAEYPEGWVTAYAYGGKVITGYPGQGDIGPFGNEPWNYDTMRRRNMVDTGALMVRSVFPGWDESLKRLQDWDLWLTMARKRLRGVWVERVLYKTPYREHGISFGGSGITFEDAQAVIRQKHGL